MNLFIVAVLALFALNILFGLLVGSVRGRKKAFIRLITLVIAFALSLLLTPVIANIAAKSGVDALKNATGDQSYWDIINSDFDTFSKIVLTFIKPLIFFIVFVAFWLLSLIVFWILAAIFGKRGKNKDGEEKSKGRLLGMIIGIACGFIMFLSLFVPLNGYLSIAGKVNNVEMNGKPVLSELNDTEIAGLGLNITEYNESAAAKLGIGLDKVCFNFLSSTKVGGQKIVLNKEVDVLCEAIQKYDALNNDDLLGDVDALESLIDTLFESKIVVVVIDFAIDYAIENPEILDDIVSNEEGSEGDVTSSFLSKELINEILVELKGNVKVQIESCLNAFRVIQNLDISLTSLDMDAIAKLSEDDEKVEELVNALFDVKIVRITLPYVITDLIKPVAESMGNTSGITRPVLTDADWENEKIQIKAIFKNFSLLSDLVNLSDTSGNLDGMEQYFVKEKAQAMGELMQTLRQSMLLNQTYYSMVSFDAEKDEYYFIANLNEMIFGGIDEEQQGGKVKTLRPLFEEYGGDKTNGVSAKDNIDFNDFAWSELFIDMSDMFAFMQNVKAMEGKTLSETTPEDVKELLESLGEMNTEMLQEVLIAIIPEDSGIVIPDMTDVDFEKEAEIFEKLYDFQKERDGKEEGESMTQDEVNEIVDTLADSDFIVAMLDNANTTVNVSDEERDMVKTALENSEIDEEKMNVIKKLFDIE